jgi:hypothetical protein
MYTGHLRARRGHLFTPTVFLLLAVIVGLATSNAENTTSFGPYASLLPCSRRRCPSLTLPGVSSQSKRNATSHTVRSSRA